MASKMRSNFNGTWDQCIDAFSEVVPARTKAIWGSSYGFPGPIPVEPFKSYIRRNEYIANHYWSAYSGGVDDRDHRGVARRGRAASLESALRGAGTGCLRRGLRGVPDRGPGGPVTRSDHDRSGQALALTMLAPIQAGHESALADALNDLPLREGSPLARVPGTHFARFVVIDAPVYQGAAQQRDSWKASRLLFTSNFDEPLDGYLDRLRTGFDADGDAIFGHCVGYPGRADAQAWTPWLLSHRNPLRAAPCRS
jgi:hypothetical protein